MPAGSAWHHGVTFARQPRAVPRRLVDVFLLELRVLVSDVVGCVAIAEQLQHKIDRDAHPTDRGFSLADRGVDANSIRHGLTPRLALPRTARGRARGRRRAPR